MPLKEEAMKVLTHSRHLFCKTEAGMNEMEEETAIFSQLCHKKQSKARIEADAKDRDGIHQKLATCIDPLDTKKIFSLNSEHYQWED